MLIFRWFYGFPNARVFAIVSSESFRVFLGHANNESDAPSPVFLGRFTLYLYMCLLCTYGGRFTFCRFLKQLFFELRRFSRSRIFSTVPVLPFQPFHNGSSRSSRSGPAVPRFPAVPGLAGTFLVVGRSVPRKPVRSKIFHSFPFRSGPCTSLIYIYISIYIHIYIF